MGRQLCQNCPGYSQVSSLGKKHSTTITRHLTQPDVLGYQPYWICLRHVRLTILQGTARGGVVRLCCHDGLLGQSGHSLHVPLPRHGKVPRDSLADD